MFLSILNTLVQAILHFGLIFWLLISVRVIHRSNVLPSVTVCLLGAFQAKPYSWMPGGGMAIEITLIGSDKVSQINIIMFHHW